uniref:Uncharacterized protein n=1 Tax=Oryza brachyantha TaxID=4533 RepID=J3N567_ORYBR
MQRLSVGSPGGRPRLLDGAAEADEKAGKKARAAPDKSIHLIPVLTLLCFLVLFLLSHDPSVSSSLATDAPACLAGHCFSSHQAVLCYCSGGSDGVCGAQRRRPPAAKAGGKAGPRAEAGDGAAVTAANAGGCDVTAGSRWKKVVPTVGASHRLFLIFLLPSRCLFLGIIRPSSMDASPTAPSSRLVCSSWYGATGSRILTKCSIFFLPWP